MPRLSAPVSNSTISGGRSRRIVARAPASTASSLPSTSILIARTSLNAKLSMVRSSTSKRMRLGTRSFGIAEAAAQMQHRAVIGQRHHELRPAGLVGQGQLMHAGAPAQHALREARVVRVRLERLDLVGNAREGVGEHPLVGAGIDGRAARHHDLVQHIQLVLAPGRLVGDFGLR